MKTLLLSLLLLSAIMAFSQTAPGIQWQKSLGGSGIDGAHGIAATKDGGYVIAGFNSTNNGDITDNHGKNDGWVIKLSSAGTLEWQKSLGGTRDDVLYAVSATTDSGCIVAGSTKSNNGVSDLWVIKLSAAGNQEWQKTFAGSLAGAAYSISQTPDGGYIIGGVGAGDSTALQIHGTAVAVKLKANGSIEWKTFISDSVSNVISTVKPLAGVAIFAPAIKALQ